MQMLLPPVATTAQGSSLVKPMDLGADDLASMEDTVYNASESSFNSSSDYDSETPLEDHPEEDSEVNYHDSEPTAPPDNMVMELPEEDPDPVMEDANMPDSTTIPLLSVGVQQQTLGAGPPTAPYGTLQPGFCFGRPRWMGVSHSSQYCMTHHSQYWHSLLPQ